MGWRMIAYPLIPVRYPLFAYFAHTLDWLLGLGIEVIGTLAALPL